jgi:hypothetical protein
MTDQSPDINIWEHKPRWCQPWSILLTGVLVILGSWLLYQRLWLTLPLGFLVIVWWFYFLWLWPRWLQKMLKERVPPSS